MKKHILFFVSAFFCTFFLNTCGNPLLNLEDKGNNGTPENSSLGTTDEDVPRYVRPIYIDSNADLEHLATQLGTPNYPADGYYILRGYNPETGVGVKRYMEDSSGNRVLDGDGNPIEERVFDLGGIIINGIASAFTGTLTGWYKDELHKTTIIVGNRKGLFAMPVEGTGPQNTAEISWIKVDATAAPISQVSIISTNVYAGIITPTTRNAIFHRVTVTGSVNIPSQSSGITYAGGFTGLADAGTRFQDCIAGANVSAQNSASTYNCYAGGFAGVLSGEITSMVVPNSAPSGSVAGFPRVNTYDGTVSYSNIEVLASALYDMPGLYAGGLAGETLVGSAINKTLVYANVTADAGSTTTQNAYAGGYVGYITSGTVSNHNPAGSSLKVSAKGASISSTNKSFAGGIAGATAVSLSSNSIAGTLEVSSQYYDGEAYSGGIVGRVIGATTIINECSVGNSAQKIEAVSHTTPASPPGTAYSGGIAGYNEGIISKSGINAPNLSIKAGFNLTPANGANAGSSYAGGLVGYNNLTIEKSYAIAYYQQDYSSSGGAVEATSSEVDGAACAGGIAGYTSSAGSILESYSVATVKSTASGNVNTTGKGASAGGIVGYLEGSVENTFAWAQVEAINTAAALTKSGAHSGGIAGGAGGTSEIKKSYAAGWVRVSTIPATAVSAKAGGIVGLLNVTGGTIEKIAAVQRYVTGGTIPTYKVCGGGTGSSITAATSFSYIDMKSIPYGVSGFGTATAPASNGLGNSSVADLKSGAYYGSSLDFAAAEWNVASSSSFPTLKNPPQSPPSIPTWANIP